MRGYPDDIVAALASLKLRLRLEKERAMVNLVSRSDTLGRTKQAMKSIAGATVAQPSERR